MSNLDTLAMKGGGIQTAESCSLSSAVLDPEKCHGQRSGNPTEMSFVESIQTVSETVRCDVLNYENVLGTLVFANGDR